MGALKVCQMFADDMALMTESSDKLEKLATEFGRCVKGEN